MPSPKISLALLGLMGSVLAHQSPVSRRKTMGFGPVHPHSKFHTGPVPSTKDSLFTPDPYDVARGFVTNTLQDQLAEENSFVLRKDSYTDKATGVTHIFFRQMINGLEVADGDINVNVKDGAVISYGDSVSFLVQQLPPLAERLFYNPSFTVVLYQAPPSLMSRSLPALMPNFATFCKTKWRSASVFSISNPLLPTRLPCLGCSPTMSRSNTCIAFTAGTASTPAHLMSSQREDSSSPRMTLTHATPFFSL